MIVQVERQHDVFAFRKPEQGGRIHVVQQDAGNFILLSADKLGT